MDGCSNDKFGVSLVLYNISMSQLKTLQLWVEELISDSYIVAVFWNSNIAGPFPDKVFVSGESGKNMGLGYAHNVNISLLRNSGCEFFMTMDQDSIIDNQSMLNLFEYVCRKHHRVLVGPILYDMNGKKLLKRWDRLGLFFGYDGDNTKDIIEVNQVIQSGMAGAIQDWSNLGGFNEFLFIGEVDFEYCQRFIDNGGAVLQLKSAKLDQQVGEGRVGIGFVSVVLHSPIRHYYNIRNQILLVCSGVYSKTVLWRTFFHALAVVVLSPFAGKKYRCFGCVVRAIKDGLTRVHGAFPYNRC